MRSTKICNKDFAKKMSVIPKGMIKPPYYRRVPNVRKIPARHWLYQRYTVSVCVCDWASQMSLC